MFGQSLATIPQQVANMPQQMANQAMATGQQAAQGFLGSLVRAPLGFIGGALNPMKLISGTVMWGGVMFLLQATSAARPITMALGGEELTSRVANPDSMGERLMMSLGAGAVVAGAINGSKGALKGATGNPEADKGIGGLGATVAGLAIAAMVARKVSVGAVSDKIELAELSGQPQATPTPGIPAKSASPAKA